MAPASAHEPDAGLMATLEERWPDWRRRAGGMALALLLELGLLLLLLTLGHSIAGPPGEPEALTTVDFPPDAPPAAEPRPTPDEARPSALPPVARPRPETAAPPIPQPIPT